MVFLAGCATVEMPDKQYFVPAEDPGYTNSSQSTVIFYRQDRFSGCAVKYYINDGNKTIGALKNDSYFIYKTDPGGHYFWAENEKISSVRLDCDPSEKYFIEGTVSMGMWMGNPELSLVPDSVAKSRLDDLQYYEFNSTISKE
jgi:hypothetical protein